MRIRVTSEEERKILQEYARTPDFKATGKRFGRDWRTIKNTVSKHDGRDAVIAKYGGRSQSPPLSAAKKEGARAGELVVENVRTESDRRRGVDDLSNRRARKRKSLPVQAYDMYRKGYSPGQVCSKLDIPAKEALQYQQEYLELEGSYALKQAHERYGEEGLKAYFLIANAMEEHNLTAKEALENIRLAPAIYDNKNQIASLREEIRIIKDEKETEDNLLKSDSKSAAPKSAGFNTRTTGII